MAQSTKLLNLRLPDELYDRLAQEVASRKAQGEHASLSSISMALLDKHLPALEKEGHPRKGH